MIQRLLAQAAALLVCAAALALAQDPSRPHLTIETKHFRVSFARPLESLARRVAANAERAYEQLSTEMHPPRGTIEILVSDDVDYSNGSAITYPTNRIVVYAMPPVNEFGLRYTTDWAQMVVTHELAHIFHLDRARGIWKLGQYVFGRSPFLFPNTYQPSWLIEGLAVYEESRLAGQGRIEGPEHTLIARAAARDHVFPGIGDASLSLPIFPQGNAAYAYGSLFFDYLARTRGDSSVRRFVESSSAQLIPYLIDIPARRAFGTRFGSAWDQWRATIEQSVRDSTSRPVPGWRELTRDMLAANYPRWLDDRTLSYTGTTGREVLKAYSVDLNGDTRSFGRRNGLSPTVRLADGTLLFSQFEYTGPYTYRSDLFTQRPGGRPRRLTTNQRLFTPDATGDGRILAMQAVEGATRLVRVDAHGNVAPLTRVSADTLWSEPRWSHDGTRIVASRWLRGGVAQIVVTDSLGANEIVIASGRFVLASPSWMPGDSAILYTVGRDGTNDVHVTRVDRRAQSRVTGVIGFFDPELRGRTLAGLTLHGRGYRLGVGEASIDAGTDTLFTEVAPDPRLPALEAAGSPARPYRALRQLTPRYWIPLIEPAFASGSYRLGGYTESWDILRRHSTYARLAIPTDNSGVVWAAQYGYRGLGLPILNASASQDWTQGPVVDRSAAPKVVGTLRRRTRDADLLATFLRQRVRSSLSLSAGVGLERREYFGDPPSVLPMVDSGGIYRDANFPRLTLSSSYARYLTPAFAISPEDGFTVAATVRERLKSGFNASGGPSTSVVSAMSLYKSLDLPGYAHHVLAGRAAGGWADTKSNGYFEVGGVSGGSFQVFPGYSIGEGRETFPVRGFVSGTLTGIRAFTGSAEYRAPLSLSHRSLGTLPAFLQRSALTLFADYGVAWCPSALASRQVCVNPVEEAKRDIASAGGELSVNAGLLSWDTPTRVRIGYAAQLRNGSVRTNVTRPFYFTVGLSF